MEKTGKFTKTIVLLHKPASSDDGVKYLGNPFPDYNNKMWTNYLFSIIRYVKQLVNTSQRRAYNLIPTQQRAFQEMHADSWDGALSQEPGWGRCTGWPSTMTPCRGAAGGGRGTEGKLAAWGENNSLGRKVSQPQVTFGICKGSSHRPENTAGLTYKQQIQSCFLQLVFCL